MKKNLFTTFVLAIALAFGFQNISAQFTITLPKLPKIKKEKPKAEQPNSENSSQDSSTKSPQETALQVRPSSVGKIYFSDKPFGATNEGNRTSFTTGDYVYGRLETGGKTLREIFGYAPLTPENPKHKLVFNLYAYDTTRPTSGEPVGYWKDLNASFNSPFVNLTEADLDKTYWNFDVLPDPAKSTTRLFTHIGYEYDEAGAAALYTFLKKSAEAKKYIVEIELVKETTDFRGSSEPEEKWLKVNGLLSLDFKTSDYAKIKASQETMEANRTARIRKAAEEENRAKIDNEPLPKAWTLKSSPLLPGLTEAKLKAMFLLDHPDRTQKQIVKLYAEPANSTQPEIMNNELGIPKYRYLRQSFIAFVKVVGENECFYQRFTPAQPYSGGGTFGGFYALLESKVDISCDKMGLQ